MITWNLFHGQDGAGLGPSWGSVLRRRPVASDTHVHLNRKWIDEMAGVIDTLAPTFAALQEVPPQAVDRIARATGMRAVRSVMRPLLGPLRLRGLLADRNPDLWRTHEGTSNVVLAAPGWRLVESWTLRHNPPAVALRAGQRLRISLRERLHWLLEPRRLVAGRFERAGETVTVISLHCHNSLVWDVIGEEVRRVLPEILARTPAGEPLIVAGDFNAAGRAHPALRAMLDAGLEEASIDELVLDHIFQRNLTTVMAPRPLATGLREQPYPWGEGTRTVLLSDHEIVEARFRLPQRIRA